MIDYEIFYRFYEKFKAQGFLNIDPDDPLVLEIHEKLKPTGQIFHVSDLIQLKILYLCGRCHEYFGVECEYMDPSVYFAYTHPNDIKRHAMGRAVVFRTASEMYVEKSENMFVSTHFKTKNSSGEYTDLLYQMILIYSEIPHKTVYSIQINTDVTSLLSNQRGYHYYYGNDMSFFRYPDKKLLMTGNIFSNREFDILKGIAAGLESHEIAKELFLSVHTVNTHRRNILLKTGKRTTHELVIELQETGVL